MLLATTYVHLDVQLLTQVVSIFLPIIVGIVTKKLASPAVKSITLAVLAVITGIASTAIQLGGDIDVSTAVNQIITSGVVAAAAYYGFWNPTGVAPAVQDKTAKIGIGKSVSEDSAGD